MFAKGNVFQKQSRDGKYLILLLFAAAVGGGTGVFAKIALKQIPPFSFTFIRFLLASLVTIPIILKKEGLPRISDKKLFLLPILLTLNVVFYSFGIPKTSVTLAQVL